MRRIVKTEYRVKSQTVAVFTNLFSEAVVTKTIVSANPLKTASENMEEAVVIAWNRLCYAAGCPDSYITIGDVYEELGPAAGKYEAFYLINK